MPNLWPEYFRIVREVLPRFVIAENVNQATWAKVCFDLHRLGYHTTTHDIHIPFRRHKRRRTYLVADTHSHGESRRAVDAEMAELCRDAGGFWPAIPESVGMDDGISSRMDRLRALGNAVVPQIPELIGRAILGCS